MEIENTLQGYELLWRELEKARMLLVGQSRRYCVRNILRDWFPPGNRPREDLDWDEFVWRICRRSELQGFQQLPAPSLQPRPLRELLLAIVLESLNLCPRQVNLHALDEAYSHVFPSSTPLNVSKKGRVSKAAT